MFEGSIWTAMRKGHWVEETTQRTETKKGSVTVRKTESHDKIRGTYCKTTATIDNVALEPINGSQESLEFLDEQIG